MASKRRQINRGETVLWGDGVNEEQDPEREKFANAVFESTQIYSTRKSELSDKWYAKDVVVNYNSNAALLNGVEAFKAFGVIMHDTLTEYHFVLDEVMMDGTIEDGRAAIKIHYEGKWNSPKGIIEIYVPGFLFYTFKQGKCIELKVLTEHHSIPEWHSFLKSHYQKARAVETK